jgi:hypothetical protein
LRSPQPATTVRGRYHTLTGARSDPKPVQQRTRRASSAATAGNAARAPRPASPSTGTSAAAFGTAGAGLAIVCLPPRTPAVLEPLASALAELPAAALGRPGASAT